MCGIAGTFNLSASRPVDVVLLKRMVSILSHRGPDEFGIYHDPDVGLGSARLSIVDLKGGLQPICNEDRTVWTVFNGEIFNHAQLRAELVHRGHSFYTQSDTEVIVHLYEEHGTAFVEQLNGQFAIAVWDSRQKRLLLARDRLGIRPLYYTQVDGSLIFASEVKAIFLDDRVTRAVDVRGLDQVFTFWATHAPRTVFENIQQLPPGHLLTAGDGQVRTQPFWQPSFPEDSSAPEKSEEYYIEGLRDLLVDSIRLQVRADVPVGVYLSGGIDSSAIAALVKNFTEAPLRTFSVSFADASYDESPYQQEMAVRLQSDHHTVRCAGTDIGEAFPKVVWHTEAPILRTAPAPLFLLSRLVRETDVKVVLTGEGGDELFLGYDLYRENKIRRAWARNPTASRRPLLFQRLYPHLTLSQVRSQSYLEAFLGAGLTELDQPHYSHIVRWNTTARTKKYYSPDLRSRLAGYDCIEEFNAALPAEFRRWHFQCKAQYIDIVLLLAGYLLASQGDRMAMAHSVEGRFPYLDHRVVEFAATVPPRLKLKVMNEKHIIKRCMERYVPSSILHRAKRAYRAPNIDSFVISGQPLDYVSELLSTPSLTHSGYFNPGLMQKLIQKCLSKTHVMGEVDNISFVGILSFELLRRQFITDFDRNVAIVPDIQVLGNGASS